MKSGTKQAIKDTAIMYLFGRLNEKNEGINK